MKGGTTEAQAAKMLGFKDGDIVELTHTSGHYNGAFVRFTAVEKVHKQTLAQLDQAVRSLTVELVRARTTARYMLAAARNMAGLVLNVSEDQQLKSAMMVAEAAANEAVTQLKALPTIFDQVVHDSPAIPQVTVAGMKGLLKIHNESKFDTPQWDKAVGKLPVGLTKPAPGGVLSVEQFNQVVAELMGGFGGAAAQAATKKEVANALQAAWDKVEPGSPASWLKEIKHGGAASLPKWYPKVVDGELVLDDATGFVVKGED